MREKCPYSELFWSVFSCIWTEYGKILRISLYSVLMRKNTDHNNYKYGHFSGSVMTPQLMFQLQTLRKVYQNMGFPWPVFPIWRKNGLEKTLILLYFTHWNIMIRAFYLININSLTRKTSLENIKSLVQHNLCDLWRKNGSEKTLILSYFTQCNTIMRPFYLKNTNLLNPMTNS